MKLEDIFKIYKLELTEENGDARKLSDFIEDLYLLLDGRDFDSIKNLINIAEEENQNIFEDFREEHEI